MDNVRISNLFGERIISFSLSLSLSARNNLTRLLKNTAQKNDQTERPRLGVMPLRRLALGVEKVRHIVRLINKFLPAGRESLHPIRPAREAVQTGQICIQ